MNSSSHTQIVLSKINKFHRLTTSDSDITIKNAMQEILHLWPEVLAAIDQATDDDELFTLNISRAVLTQVFTIILSKDFFNKDHLLVREIFFSCFNILVNHAYIFKTTNSTPRTIFIDSNVRLLMKMITSITSLVKFQNDDFSNIDDQQLFIAMREHIDQDCKHDNLTDGIISLIWNLSDRTILVPLFLNTDYAYSVIEWIKTRETKFLKRLLSIIFPTTNDVYGFHLDEPSTESLHCYEQYAKIARDACSLPTTSTSNNQNMYELSLSLYRSMSSSSSFEIVSPVINERSKLTQQQQQQTEQESLQQS
ncbi:unnamed protein product, partial [Rotaria sp. Silwood2]